MVLPCKELDDAIMLSTQRGYMEEQIQLLYEVFNLTAHSEAAKIFSLPDHDYMSAQVAEIILPIMRWLEPQSCLTTVDFTTDTSAASILSELKEKGIGILGLFREEVARPLIPPDKEPRTFSFGNEEFLERFPSSFYTLRELAYKTTGSEASEIAKALSCFTDLGRELRSITEERIDERRLRFQPSILRDLLESAHSFIGKKTEIERGFLQLIQLTVADQNLSSWQLPQFPS